MNAKINITGERYGRLVAINRLIIPNKRSTWVFKCDCGEEIQRLLEHVRQGTTKSCGCLKIDRTRERSITHGHSVGRKASRTLSAYQKAKERCYNPNIERYPQYGGRGIVMSDEWRKSFTTFLEDMGECPPKMSLDRIDVNGNYEKGNCRWVTSAQQARNRTDNVFVSHGGKEVILKDFATIMGVKYKTLHARVKYKGQTPHEAAAYLLSKL